MQQGTATEAPAPGTSVGAVNQCVITPEALNSPALYYRAMRAQRSELLNTVERLKDERLAIAQRLRGQGGDAADGPDKTGLEARIKDLDAQILAGSARLAQADNAVACAAGVPGAPDWDWNNGPPPEAMGIAGLFILVVLLPISIAVARRVWRRGTAAVTSLPKELMDRLNQIEHTVESVAIEVERVGEGQRFVTNLLIENGPHMLGAGAMEQVKALQAEKVAR